MNKEIANPKGFILITSIVLMFVSSSIIFAYFMKISHEYQRVEVNIAQAKAKYNARSGLAYEAYENMFFRHFIDTLANGEPEDSMKYFAGSSAVPGPIMGSLAGCWDPKKVGKTIALSFRELSSP